VKNGTTDHLRRATVTAALAGDLLALAAVVFTIPFIILAVGLPIAALVQLLLLIGRLF
jgi:hypothetical protein